MCLWGRCTFSQGLASVRALPDVTHGCIPFGAQQALPVQEGAAHASMHQQAILFMLIKGDAVLFLLVYFTLLVCRVFFVNLPYLFKC